ncbi:hypothetical protein EV401DRAFT_811659 [Pisolithus croceorrhizus]|nr:hypothetical protein EV401DRAFT_811659 [Pisolithus croceorrhizus]
MGTPTVRSNVAPLCTTQPDRNQTSRMNPSAVPQIKVSNNCERKKCLYPGPNGTRCLQQITRATVPKHFVGHGTTNKSLEEIILCQWEECFEEVVRHKFVRHIREKHLGHVRDLPPTTPEKNAAVALSYRISRSGDIQLIGTSVVYPLNC